MSQHAELVSTVGSGRGALALVVAAVVVGAGLLTYQAVTADAETGGGSVAPQQ